MRHSIVLAGALALAACGMFGPDRKAAPKAPLDGKTFAAQMVSGGKSEPDELVFKDGTFHSAAAGRHGFAATKYTTVKEGEFMRFEVIATSQDSGTMTWNGTVKGEALEGTAVWDQAWWRPDREYTIKGKLKD